MGVFLRLIQKSVHIVAALILGLLFLLGAPRKNKSHGDIRGILLLNVELSPTLARLSLAVYTVGLF